MTENTNNKAKLGRRDVLKAAGVGVVAAAGASLVAGNAHASPEGVAKYLSEMTGGAAAKEGKVSIKLPEIAENGRTVPLTVSVDGATKAIHVAAEGNPNPQLVSFHLDSETKAEVSTRIRLGKTQNVVVAAVMADGSVFTGKQNVKVTIGGCGG